MPWEVDLTNTFRRGYKNLSVEIRKRVDEALLQLIDSDDPRGLGSRKDRQVEGRLFIRNRKAVQNTLQCSLGGAYHRTSRCGHPRYLQVIYSLTIAY